MIRYRYGLFIILLFIFMAVGVVACNQAESKSIFNTPESPAIAPSAEEVAVDTSLDAEEDEALPESTSSNHCLECHADQQMLVDTAAPIEVVESENEGEG